MEGARPPHRAREGPLRGRPRARARDTEAPESATWRLSSPIYMARLACFWGSSRGAAPQEAGRHPRAGGLQHAGLCFSRGRPTEPV